MNVIDAITNRRSIRKYQDKEVPDEVFYQIIDAARLAPSACNCQPWKFKIVRKDKIKELDKANAFKQKFVYSASGLIVICSDLEAYDEPQNQYQVEEGSLTPYLTSYIAHHLASSSVRTDMSNKDIGIAAAYMGLRAHELGIGTCLIKLEKTIRLGKILEIPDKYNIKLTMTLGYPAENPKSRPRKKIEEVLIK